MKTLKIKYSLNVLFKFRILVEHDANLAAVNNEGEVPLDLADEDEMDEYLSDEIDNQGIHI